MEMHASFRSRLDFVTSDGVDSAHLEQTQKWLKRHLDSHNHRRTTPHATQPDDRTHPPLLPTRTCVVVSSSHLTPPQTQDAIVAPVRGPTHHIQWSFHVSETTAGPEGSRQDGS